MSPPRVVLQTAIFSLGHIKAVVVNSLWRSRLPNTGEQRLFPLETSCGIDVMCIKRANDEAATKNEFERKDFCHWLCPFARFARENKGFLF